MITTEGFHVPKTGPLVWYIVLEIGAFCARFDNAIVPGILPFWALYWAARKPCYADESLTNATKLPCVFSILTIRIRRSIAYRK